MTRVQAAVYFLHEDEEAAAYRAIRGPDRIEAGGYVMGEIDEADLAELEARGLAVERIDPAADETWVSYLTTGERDLAAFGTDDILLSPMPLPEPEPGEEASWAIRVNGPLVDEWRNRLAALGLTVLERVSQFGYLARGTSAAANECLQLPFVQRVERAVPPVSPARTVSAMGLQSDDAVALASEDFFDVVLDGMVPVGEVVADLVGRSIDVVERGMRRVRIRARPGDPLLLDPRPIAGVLGISQHVEPELLNDRARLLLGVGVDAMGAKFGLDGTGEIVAVTDTGIDDAHPDFSGRLLHVLARGRNGDTSDPHGHGTHVAGSIVGTGAASGGTLRGVAPAASLIFQSVLDASNGLGGLRAGVHELLDEAFQLGARVHNHSWGAIAGSEYRADSLEVDGFVWEHPEMLVVVAAGNDGTAASPQNAPAGFVDLFSLRAPATAKNALTVGAACSDRGDGSMAGRTWQTWPGRRFPPGGVGDALIAGDPEGLAGFSSRGPCQDRRVKPDVVAPGTDILSTRSAGAPSNNFWGECQQNSHYAYMGGTSMAAPIAAGMAVLVRQWYVSRGHQPSAALLKGTLINGTRWLSSADAVSSNAAAPNYDQGFGSLYLPTTLPAGGGDPPLELRFVDTLNTPALQFAKETDRPVQVKVDVGSRHPLRICLCFIDAPGRFTQNDLTLIVERPDGAKVFGNDARPKQFNGPDVDNTAEIVRFPSPTAGTYVINVVARNILRAPQGFALVASGDLGAMFEVGRH